MKFSAYSLLSIAWVVGLVPFLNGQQAIVSRTATAQALSNPDTPDSCPHPFTSGSPSSNSFIQYCVTDNGNITAIETPFGHPMIGTGGEGYGLCQESPAVQYYDYAVSDSGNWNSPQILSLTKSSIKISRTTSDFRWTLVQTISKLSAMGSIKVAMSLTNNTRFDLVAYLVRFADVDPDGAHGMSETTGGSLQSAWSWDSISTNTFHYGLQLLNAAKTPFGYQQGFAQYGASGPNACNFAGGSAPAGVIFSTHDDNNSIVYAYVGLVAAGQTQTVTLNYRAM